MLHVSTTNLKLVKVHASTNTHLSEEFSSGSKRLIMTGIILCIKPSNNDPPPPLPHLPVKGKSLSALCWATSVTAAPSHTMWHCHSIWNLLLPSFQAVLKRALQHGGPFSSPWSTLDWWGATHVLLYISGRQCNLDLNPTQPTKTDNKQYYFVNILFHKKKERPKTHFGFALPVSYKKMTTENRDSRYTSQ